MTVLGGEGALFFEDFLPERPSRFDVELDTAVSTFALAQGTIVGKCNVAGAAATFAVTDPNLRENLFANVSGTGARHRLLAFGLSQALFDTPLISLPATAEVINARHMRVFLTETTTPFHRAAKELIAPELFVTSEYFGDEYASGSLVNSVRHEDLQKTSFLDGTFDFVITSDVMEHVPDAPAAEREIIRILKPGGAYCFTVPLHAMAEQDRIMALLQPDGTIEYLEEPMYHGDPLRPEGVLVFRIFSVTEMHARFAALGARCTTYRVWSKYFGILSPGCWIHVVRKALTP